jgi:hypothetical protein
VSKKKASAKKLRHCMALVHTESANTPSEGMRGQAGVTLNGYDCKYKGNQDQLADFRHLVKTGSVFVSDRNPLITPIQKLSY